MGRLWRLVRRLMLVGAIVALVLMLRPSSPPEPEVDGGASIRVEQKLAQLDQAVQAGAPHTLDLSEAELNTLVASNLGTGAAADPSVAEVQSNVRDVRITLGDDTLHGWVLFALYGKDVTLDLDGQLGVEDGFLRFRPTQGRLGALPIPQATLDSAVRRVFEAEENRERFRVPPELADIRVEGGRLKVVYR